MRPCGIMDKAPAPDLGIAGSSPAKVVDFSSNMWGMPKASVRNTSKNKQITSIWLWAMCYLIEVTFPIHWANAERLSPYEPKQKDFILILSQKKETDFLLYWANDERHSPDKGPMQNNIPLCWAYVEWSKALNIYLSIFDKDVLNTFGTKI